MPNPTYNSVNILSVPDTVAQAAYSRAKTPVISLYGQDIVGDNNANNTTISE